VIVWGV